MADAIPIEQVVDQIKQDVDWVFKAAYARGYNTAKAEIALSGEYERAYQRGKADAQQWIPCSERLPEKEGWYITTVESEKTGKRRIENDLFAIDIALAHGHTPNKFCKDGYRQRTVAWCEFPEPWRGEDNDS